VISEAVSV